MTTCSALAVSGRQELRCDRVDPHGVEHHWTPIPAPIDLGYMSLPIELQRAIEDEARRL